MTNIEPPHTQVAVDSPPPSAASDSSNLLGMISRVLIPILLLAVGVGSFLYLSVEPEEEKAPPAKKQDIRTRVAKLKITDYPVVIKTNGIVQSHNEVSFSSQVSGQIISVSPSFEVGAYFREGEVLMELDSRDYETAKLVAEAQKLGAESTLELAKETHQRNSKLYEKNGVSEAVLKQAFAAMAQAEAQLDTSKAQLERAVRDLERTKIVAPFDGRVRTKNVGVGQSVGVGAPIGVLFAIDFAEVRLPIASKEMQYLDLPELASDATVEVELTDAINKDNKAVWQAKIVRTEGALDVNSLELFAIARIDDPFGRKSGLPPLRIGQPVIASIKGKTLDNVVAIPRFAVRQLDQVYFVDEDFRLSSKTIEPLWSDEDHLIIQDPLIEEGQMLATTRIVYAPDGAKVEIIPEIEDAVETPSTETKSTSTTKKPDSN